MDKFVENMVLVLLWKKMVSLNIEVNKDKVVADDAIVKKLPCSRTMWLTFQLMGVFFSTVCHMEVKHPRNHGPSAQ